MKYLSAIAGTMKKMLSTNNSISGLQICMVVVVSMAVPSIFALTVLLPAPSAKQEVLSVCRAPQRAFLPLAKGQDDTCKLDNGDTAWETSTNVHAGVDTASYVEGVASTKLEVQDQFTTGRIARINTIDNTRALNFSDIECITFWIKSSEELDDDILQLQLFDTSSGTASVHIDIPGNSLNGQDWQRVSAIIPDAYAVDNNIEAIAIYATKDPGNVTIWLDVIEARIAFESQNFTKSFLNELVLNNDAEVILAS